MEEELAIPFHAQDGRVDEVEGLTAEVTDGGFDAVDGELVGGFTEVQAAAESGRLDRLLAA